jgi:hypothetical protein
LSKDQLADDAGFQKGLRRSDLPSPRAAIFRGLILRHDLRVSAIILPPFCRAPKAQPPDDGILMIKFSTRMMRWQAVA